MIPSPEAIKAAELAYDESMAEQLKDFGVYSHGISIKAALTAAAPYHFEDAAKVAEDAAKEDAEMAVLLSSDDKDRPAYAYTSHRLTRIAAAIRALARPET